MEPRLGKMAAMLCLRIAQRVTHKSSFTNREANGTPGPLEGNFHGGKHMRDGRAVVGVARRALGRQRDGLMGRDGCDLSYRMRAPSQRASEPACQRASE